jgi:ubiquinone/menaquinone biosynthesis C-methylase UbiE
MKASQLIATEGTRRRYQRIAPFYDLIEFLPDRGYLPWRERLWSQVEGPKILEVGVGTGKNMPFYPKDAQLTAIDLTPGMLKRARKRAESLKVNVDLQLGDVQALDFHDNSFDTVVATFVFCSVPDPVLGLREILRVIKQGGQVLLLEHVRSANKLLGEMMDLFNPLVVRMVGANINRCTVDNIHSAGLFVESHEKLGMGDIFRMIIARGYTAEEER